MYSPMISIPRANYIKKISNRQDDGAKVIFRPDITSNVDINGVFITFNELFKVLVLLVLLMVSVLHFY